MKCLCHYCREGHLDVARLLLENKAEVNIPSGSESNIPLTLACWKGMYVCLSVCLHVSVYICLCVVYFTSLCTYLRACVFVCAHHNLMVATYHKYFLVNVSNIRCFDTNLLTCTQYYYRSEVNHWVLGR